MIVSDSDGCDVLTTVVASLTTGFVVSSIIFFIVGFVCGQKCCGKFKGSLNQASDSNSARPAKGLTVPIYESTLSDTTQCHEEQAIKLEENVAYGPVSVS